MTVDSRELRKIADNIRENAATYNKYIEEIYNKLKGSLHEFWAGTDYDEFIKIMESKRQSVDSITNSLKSTKEK